MGRQTSTAVFSSFLVGAEFETKERTTMHVRIVSMTLCHQVCVVRLRVHVRERRVLVVCGVLHEHVLQHDVCRP